MVQNSPRRLGLACLALGIGLLLPPSPAPAGGGGGSVETIKVTKCEYADVGAYVELLVSATSSKSGAALYAYLPDGEPLGQVFSGGRYGGTVFVTFDVPDTITIISSSGAWITVPCAPYQP